jgi:hypothetical protein
MLRVGELTVAGAALHGAQTSATLPGIVFGNGSVVIDAPATIVLFQ